MVLTELLTARGMEPQGIYDVPTLAVLLNVHRMTVRRFIRMGDLKAIRRGRAIMGVLHSDLQTYLEAKNGGSKC
jgi:excisionase family DNA binding protein